MAWNQFQGWNQSQGPGLPKDFIVPPFYAQYAQYAQDAQAQDVQDAGSPVQNNAGMHAQMIAGRSPQAQGAGGISLAGLVGLLKYKRMLGALARANPDMGGRGGGTIDPYGPDAGMLDLGSPGYGDYSGGGRGG